MRRVPDLSGYQMCAVILLAITWCPDGHAALAAVSENPVQTGQHAMTSHDASTPPAVVTTQPASQPVSRRYTQPSVATRRIVLGKVEAVGAPVTGSGTAARQASEAKVSASSLSTAGAAGLAAAQPRTITAVNSIPGIQRGYAAGLGFAGRQNVLTWQRNPADRPCRDLVRAGFFPNLAACRGRFKR
jgi:hypothetical protein